LNSSRVQSNGLQHSNTSKNSFKGVFCALKCGKPASLLRRNTKLFTVPRAPTITCASSPIFGPYVAPVATWGQAGTFTIYNSSNIGNGCDCDRDLAGCGPIALSALMTYHQSPVENMTIGNETIFTDYANWSPTGGQSNSVCTSTDLSVKGPAMLAKLCGSAMNAWYGVLGTCNTAVYPWNIGDGLDAFDYAHDGKGDFKDRYRDVKDDLIQGRPVIMSGTTGGVNLPNYHIWLIDGWKEVVLSCWTKYEFFNMNWGWCGTNNGWFYTRGGQYVDDYDTYLEVYTNIRPN